MVLGDGAPVDIGFACAMIVMLEIGRTVESRRPRPSWAMAWATWPRSMTRPCSIRRSWQLLWSGLKCRRNLANLNQTKSACPSEKYLIILYVHALPSGLGTSRSSEYVSCSSKLDCRTVTVSWRKSVVCCLTYPM